MRGLSVRVFRSLAELTPHRDALDALNLASRRPCPFSTPAYVETFLAHDEFGASERELLFLTAFDGDQLVGYLPLRKHRERTLGLPWTKISVLISHDTDRPHVIARREDEARCAQAFYAHLLEHERGWSLLELALQDSESALLEVPPLKPWRHWARRFPNMPVSRAKLPWKSMPEYLGAMPGSHRKNFMRSLRRTFGAGHAEAVSCADPRGLPAMLDLYLALERRSWKAAGHAGISRTPQREAFFRALGEAGQPMRLGVHLLLVDDLPVSGAVTGEFEGVLHGFETCFDQDYEDLGCGHLGVLLAFRHAFSRGLGELNLNGNYAYNKSNFGGVATETVAVQLYRVGSLPWLKARLGQLKQWWRPSDAQAIAFNPERRAHEQHAEVRPPRLDERAQVRSTLLALEQRGVELERLSGAALETTFAVKPEGGSPHDVGPARVDRDADVQPARHHRPGDRQRAGAALRELGAGGRR